VLVGRDPPFTKDMSAEAEESQVLEANTGKRLVKTLQAGEDLVSALVICEV
jgi:hypothetical protein